MLATRRRSRRPTPRTAASVSPTGGVLEGRAEIERIYRIWLTAFPGYRLRTRIDLLIDGDRAVQIARRHGHAYRGLFRTGADGPPLRGAGRAAVDGRLTVWSPTSAGSTTSPASSCRSASSRQSPPPDSARSATVYSPDASRSPVRVRAGPRPDGRVRLSHAAAHVAAAQRAHRLRGAREGGDVPARRVVQDPRPDEQVRAADRRTEAARRHLLVGRQPRARRRARGARATASRRSSAWRRMPRRRRSPRRAPTAPRSCCTARSGTRPTRRRSSSSPRRATPTSIRSTTSS